MKQNNLRPWSARLEAGERDDELLALAARLERAASHEPAAVPLDYRRQLRRDLLNRYPAAQRAGRPWRLIQTVAAVGGLALVVILVWFTMSSLQRPSFGGAPVITEPAASGYMYLSHTVSDGVLPLKIVETGGEGKNQEFLIPGSDLTFVVYWRLPANAPQLSAFAHLLNETGAVVAQSDALLSADDSAAPERYTSDMRLSVPETLSPGRYQLVAGLYDPANGSRMPITGRQGETTELALGEYELLFSDNAPFRLRPEDGDALDVRAVTPVAGTILSGTAPLRFSVTLDHALSSLSQALLEIRVAALEGENGRGVGLATVDLVPGVGRSTVEIMVNTEELTDPTELGLWLQLKPDAASAPILIEMPGAYRWRYEP